MLELVHSIDLDLTISLCISVLELAGLLHDPWHCLQNKHQAVWHVVFSYFEPFEVATLTVVN